ncbi:Glycosyltransferase involved in cell wall bisynthesis [Salegentibacter agarivorans]|uniref:Glycosyltransferase involved in cell wall bisynthesis n=1 Tax=Salegentibacter agarivorans TaxID=345907 RepID=A0A1I2L615_9FLAO|nr:glycosyltransferase family 2 protein [Salegentibacter agarivorans]SFF74363.1 Glycosyltransferase involved in cell wall bisynthesis [Salegentibacter agarivorans]
MRKVSIIIPNFNRAHLILETLQSVVNQNYTNWECVIVDDGSTDNSLQVIQDFIYNDDRFTLLKRPLSRRKGANACRNYGFEKSDGYYVQWFDSDDIMTIDHIEKLVSAIEINNVDFAVGDSQNFQTEKGKLGKPYNFDRKSDKINANNFGRQVIGWITDDFLGKREVLCFLKFNEAIITDGDEYNFFTRFLLLNKNGIFVNEILTYARIHDVSLSTISSITPLLRVKSTASVKILTLDDINKTSPFLLKEWYLSGYAQYAFKLALEKEKIPYFLKSIVYFTRMKSVTKMLSFVLGISLAYIVGKGYSFIKFARN